VKINRLTAAGWLFLLLALVVTSGGIWWQVQPARAMGDNPPLDLEDSPTPAPTPTPEPTPAPTPEPLITGAAGAKQYVNRARAAIEAGDHAAAAAMFLNAAKAHPAITDGALDEAARAQLASGDYAGGIGTLLTLGKAYAGRPVAADITDRLAKAYEQAGDDATALAMHQQAADNASDLNRRVYHLLRLAELHWADARPAPALAIVGRVLKDMSPNRYTIRAMRLYHTWALPSDALGAAQHAEALGRRMLKDDMYEQAGAALDAAVQLRAQAGQPVSPTSDLWRLAGFCFYRTHHNEQALVYYEGRLAAGVALSAAQLHEMGKLYTRLGDHEGVARTYDRISRHPSGGYRTTAAYYRAWLAIEDKSYKKSFAYFDGRCRASKGRNELACWLAAWSAFQNGHKKTATNLLATAAGTRRFTETLRYNYWRGRSLLESGQTKAGLATLQKINAKVPYDYYGVLAAEQLAANKAPHTPLADHMATPGGGSYAPGNPAPGWWREYKELKESRLPHAMELAEIGLWRTAGAELGRIDFPKKLSPVEDYAMAKLCHRAKRFDLARKFAYRGGVYSYLKNSNESLLSAYYPYFMPLGYREHIEKYAKRFNLPPALPFAIILHESGYRAQVVSPAYAVGLMQILPQTGAQIAAALGEPYDEDSLYDPETNIRFGCWYLRHLLDQLGGRPAYAIAAYNAGPKAVGKWLRNKHGEPEDAFVAEVAYQETNRYVRKVLTSMKKYEVLLAASHRP
jgi:soluble lytic murein transglycosylase-like protein